jgi:hypothetical protein
MKLKCSCAAGFALGFILLTSPAFASSVDCVSGNLSTIDYTTCDIGTLQFTFEGLGSAIWSDADFMFTVLPNGFELSGPPAQTVTAPLTGGAYSEASLNYYVVDPAGTITGLELSGGNPSVSLGPGDAAASNSFYLSSLCGDAQCNPSFLAYNELFDGRI